MSSAIRSVLRPAYLPELELHRPAKLDELLRHLADGARPLAGGTDILLWASQRGAPRRLVWTGGVDALHVFECGDDPLRVGAAVAVAHLVRSAAFRTAVPAVVDGAQLIGSLQLRNQATLVGNICTASPAGDTIPGLLVHDAVVEIVATLGDRRRLGLNDFLVGPGRSGLRHDELAIAVTLSRLGPREASAYRRFTQRNALDLAFASVAARLAFESDGRTVSAARLALGAVAPVALEVPEAAATLVGQPLNEATLRACAEAAAEACSPISDQRASADYRRQLVMTLVHDVVGETARRAQASERRADRP